MKIPAMTIDLEYLDTLIQKDKEKGLFRCKREMFTSKDLFDLEMKHIFEGNWIYLAHESQLPKVNDYYTTKIGRQPVFITRNKDGVLNCFINACAHRGATLARMRGHRGNAGRHRCHQFIERHIGAQRVVGQRHVEPPGLEGRCQKAEQGFVARLPVARVQVQHHPLRLALGGEEVEALARVGAIGQVQLGAGLRGGGVAVGLKLREQGREAWPALALDVLELVVVHGGHGRQKVPG